MITVYNPEIGDCLIVMLESAAGLVVESETRGDVTRTFTENKTVGFNFFKVAEALHLEKAGQVFLNEQEVDFLNQRLVKENFKEQLVVDDQPKIVVGKVLELVPHPDSDHLSITQTEVADGKILQIVCGAPNVAAGQKVVAALPGALMPDGTAIFPGVLRGVESFGMLCSARELGIPNAPKEKGILILPEAAVVGQAYPNTRS
ncbi:YtpR family tRNA-binding protein [Enterococcus timonensis]|uniref:YtpR family tRNA-binding protein n=1 Tax=Enterococcus timonensis TaxID=1852364 RepID=UPI0008DB0AC2|nr:DUF4479 and tRNA-binding domain-containing protein [Enterococcus timonensis]